MKKTYTLPEVVEFLNAQKETLLDKVAKIFMETPDPRALVKIGNVVQEIMPDADFETLSRTACLLFATALSALESAKQDEAQQAFSN